MNVILTALLWIVIIGYGFSQDYSVPDSIAAYQTCVAANSINDGQPGPPNLPFFQATMFNTPGDNFSFNLCAASTFTNSGFLRNSLLTLGLISLQGDNETIDYDKSLTTSWQHRWTYEQNNAPTISTNFTVQVPIDELETKANITGTLIIVKNLESNGVAYLNANVNSNFEDFLGEPSVCVLLGRKYFLPQNINMFTDFVFDFNNSLTFELAFEINLPNGWVISPGINYGFQIDEGTESFGLGAVVLFQTE